MDLSLSGTESGYRYEAALNEITSTQIIQNGAHVGYRAGSEIRLQTGFHAQPGSDFMAYLYTCIPFSNPRIRQEEFAGQEEEMDVSQEFKLSSLENGEQLKALPNPFSEETLLVFRWDARQKGRLKLLDLRGRVLMDLSDQVQMISDELGEVRLSGTGLASGMYLCILEQGEIRESIKLIVERK